MPDESSAGGATPQASNPAAGATPGGHQQGTDSGATPGAGSTEGATPDTPLDEAGKAALDKERGARREAERTASEARRRIAELEDAGKSETEKLRAQHQRAVLEVEQRDKRIADLESELSERDLRDLKKQVAEEHGLPATMASRLQGSDLRSLRGDAKAMAEDLAAGTPVGQVGIGRGGTATGARRVDMNQRIREAAGRGSG